jgi:paraquat-inducible protein B
VEKETCVAKRPNPTLIGGFLLIGAVLTVVAIAVWGSGRFFQRTYRCVLYFSGSVNGLGVGAPVKSRGVAIGRVVGMRLRFDQHDGDLRVPVFIDLNGTRLREMGLEEEPTKEVLGRLIEQGLRGRLQSQSLVTGQLYVNLDFFPGTKYELVEHHGKYAEIPTLPTAMEEATKSLTGLLEQIKTMDLSGTAKSLASAVAGLDRLVNKPAIGATLAELPSTVASIREMVKTIDNTIDARGPVLMDIQRAVVDVQKAAAAVKSFAEFLQRNPNSLLVGRKKQ